MIEQDTVKLLRECDAGVKMGVESIDEVMGFVHSKELKSYLNECKDQHLRLNDEIQEALTRFGDDGKNPNPVAKGMSWLKTNVKLSIDGSDETVADLITDGCNMGVKSLNRYLNEYEAADQTAKEITKKLIRMEKKLAVDIRKYL